MRDPKKRAVVNNERAFGFEIWVTEFDDALPLD